LSIRSKPEYFVAATFLALVTLLASAFASADVTTSDAGAVKKRPKICLVLSGGGARGAAHVGVIKILEELRVPIDCIAGNSMGALVGAAYASGNNVADLEKLVGGLSTDLLFRDSPPRSEIQIRRKIEDRSLLISPEIGVNSLGGDVLPRGIVSGVQIENVFRRITARGYRDFDKLPILYRAVATNLVTGQEVVFDKGELAAVMRASMSVPVAIAPTVVDGKLLVDGMLVDNMPVDVARAMGADIIIAVNVGTPLKTRQELGSILGVAGQMLSILTEQNVQAALAALRPTDILISPDLGNFSTGDFDNLPAIVPLGEAAARKMSGQLSKLSLSPEQYAAYRKGIPELSPPDLRPVDEIRFNKMKYVNSEYALSLMDTQPDEPLVQPVLDKDMSRIYGTDDFEHVGYDIVDDQGHRILAVDAEEKTWGPNYVRFGLGLNTDFKGDSNFNLQVRHRKTWLNTLGAELTTDVLIGQFNIFRSEFFQPLDNSHHFFVAPSVLYKQYSQDLYSNDQSVARYNIKSYLGGLDIGSDLDQYGEVRLGISKGIVNPSLAIGPPSLAPTDSIHQGAYTASFLADQLDSVTFPTSGWSAGARLFKSVSALGADDIYTKWNANGQYVKTFGRNTFSIYGAYGGKLNGTLPVYDQNQWGGFFRQSGYRTNQFLGETLKFGRLTYYNKLRDYKIFDGLYSGFSLELGQMLHPLVPSNSSNVMKSGSVFLATDTPIGPLYLGYGRASGGNSSLYLYLGILY